MRRCDHCRYFRPYPPADEPDQMIFSGDEIRGGGECRRNPPTLAERDFLAVFPIACFPIVANDCWCGHFEPSANLA